MNQMTELDQAYLTDEGASYLTEIEIRALLNSQLNNLSSGIRVIAGTIQGTGDDPWSLTPSDMNIKLGLNSEQSIQGWGNTMTFSATDANTVEWTLGSITLSSGKIYSIIAGNTGNMSAINYIYLDVGTSETVLQTTTTAATAVGSGKILVGVAQNNAGSDATFQIFGGSGGVLLKADNIAANSITVNEIAANTITATEMNVSTLSSIAANFGTMTAGTITGATIQTASSGYRAVMTSSNGFQLYNGATWQGSMSADSAAAIILNSVGNIYLRKSGAQMAHFTGNSVDFPSTYTLTWAGGTNFSNHGSYWRFDRGGEFNGSIEPDSDNAWKCGGSSRRWSEGWFEDITVDDLIVKTECSGCGYAELNYLSDKEKESFFNDLKTCRDGGKHKKSKKKKLIKATKFEEGDVLAWKKGKLVKCKIDACRCVRGVANTKGIPIIFGAELIKVIGEVRENQFLVGSATAGFARAWTEESEPPTGSVIGQSMEDKLDKRKSKIMAGIFKC